MKESKFKKRINDKEWKKAIIVREPMERLASCYNDKIIAPVENHMSPYGNCVQSGGHTVMDVHYYMVNE